MLPGDWDAHERRLALLESSLLRQAAAAGHGTLIREHADVATQTASDKAAAVPRPETASVATQAEEAERGRQEVRELRARAGVLQAELLRAVEALEAREGEAAAEREHAAAAAAAADAAAAARIEAIGTAADSAVAAARTEQARSEQQAAAAAEQAAKAEAALGDLRVTATQHHEAAQERLRAAEAATAAAQLELERERFQRRASEGEAVAAAREDAATAARALRAAQAEVERLQSGRARLQDEKEELEEALRGARADLMAAHAQVSKATEELTDEVSKARRGQRHAEERLQERAVIERELKTEVSRLASAVAAGQVERDAAVQRVEEAARARMDTAVADARHAGLRQGAADAEAAAKQKIDQHAAECVRLEADLRQQRRTHHDELESIRADTRALLAEHEMVSAQLAECQRAAAEDGETRARVEAEREGIVRDLMALVQQQRGKLKRAQAETDALRAELADTSLAERLRAAEEALAAQRAEGHAALAAAATARAEAADAKREAAAVQTRAAAAQRAAEEASAEAGRKATAAEEVRAGAEARIARAETAAADTADTLKIKKAMLASAAEQVAELKVELDEALQDAMDARAAVEDGHAEAEERAAVAAAQAAAAQADAEAATARALAAEKKTAAEVARASELEAAVLAAKAAVKERDVMLKEVENGMDQVKQLYGRKVEKVERDRDEAVLRCKDLQDDLKGVHAQCADLQARAREREEAARKAQDAVASEGDKCKQAVAAAEARVQEVEKEMRLLLQAFEDERAASAAKAAQLADVLKAWR